MTLAGLETCDGLHDLKHQWRHTRNLMDLEAIMVPCLVPLRSFKNAKVAVLVQSSRKPMCVLRVPGPEPLEGGDDVVVVVHTA